MSQNTPFAGLSCLMALFAPHQFTIQANSCKKKKKLSIFTGAYSSADRALHGGLLHPSRLAPSAMCGREGAHSRQNHTRPMP
jgi:hypothetical protein